MNENKFAEIIRDHRSIDVRKEESTVQCNRLSKISCTGDQTGRRKFMKKKPRTKKAINNQQSTINNRISSKPDDYKIGCTSVNCIMC